MAPDIWAVFVCAIAGRAIRTQIQTIKEDGLTAGIFKQTIPQFSILERFRMPFDPVIKALRQNGIAVTALHSHMLEEQPRIFFMHFWANDDAMKLAKGLRAALDQT